MVVLKKRFLRIIQGVILASFSFAVGALAIYMSLTFSNIFVRNTPIVNLKDDVNISEDNKKSINVLLLGYGGVGHDGGNLSDVVMVANINPQTKTVTLISIPRDLWVEIPVRSDKKDWHKINAAYAIGTDDKNYPLKEPLYKGESGGGNMAKKVIASVSGLSIDYFAAVDFEGFKNIIDTLGGIEVEVPVGFDDFFYPVKGLENETCGFSSAKIAELHQKYSGFELEKQFECRYEHIHFDKGKNKMDGQMSLKFVRSRHSDQHGGDFARSQRQNAVLAGTKEKLLSLAAVRNVDEIFNQFVKMTRTDLDLSTLKSLAKILGDPKNYSVKHINLSTDNVLLDTKSLDGQFILLPKEGEGVWSGVQNFILQNI